MGFETVSSNHPFPVSFIVPIEWFFAKTCMTNDYS